MRDVETMVMGVGGGGWPLASPGAGTRPGKIGNHGLYN